MAVKRFVLGQLKHQEAVADKTGFDKPDEELTWRDALLETLIRMEPSAERLTQRLLRESGFTQVEVTGQTGDGGIDGKGIMRLGGLLSFHVMFQCKKYRGSVSASQVPRFPAAQWWANKQTKDSSSPRAISRRTR